MLFFCKKESWDFAKTILCNLSFSCQEMYILLVAHENLAWKETTAEMEVVRQSHETCQEVILTEIIALYGISMLNFKKHLCSSGCLQSASSHSPLLKTKKFSQMWPVSTLKISQTLYKENEMRGLSHVATAQDWELLVHLLYPELLVSVARPLH